MNNFFNSKVLAILLAITLMIPILSVSMKAEQDDDVFVQETFPVEDELLASNDNIELLTSTSDNIVYNNDFDDDTGIAYGWYAGYGGEIALSASVKRGGIRSLALYGRSKSWHSPAFNIYELVRNNGAGTYLISMCVRVDGLDSSNHKTRILVRGTGENSFITKHSTNYFCAASSTYQLTDNQWRLIQGTITVKDSDISSDFGQFNLMIDLLEPVQGQTVYIDDVLIRKDDPTSDEFTLGRSTLNLGLGKQYRLVAIGASNPSYSSLNTDVATVSSTGLITAVGPGTTTIVVIDGDETLLCYVNVSRPTFQAAGLLSHETYYIKSIDWQKYLYANPDGKVYSHEMTKWGDLDTALSNIESIRFDIDYVGNGLYTIAARGMNAGKKLDGTTVTQSSSELWHIINYYDGYRIINSTTFDVLSLPAPLAQTTLNKSYESDSLFRFLKGPQSRNNENQYYGASTTTYGTKASPNCPSGYRGSATVCADSFLSAMTSDTENRFQVFNKKNSNATKQDFMSKKLNPYISGYNIDDVDFMLFVGHGFRGSYLHFDYAADGSKHNETDDCHMGNNKFCLTNEEAKFGYGNARTRWVAAYTCNYLNNESEFITDDLLREKMMGCNIVLGYKTVSYLNSEQADMFAAYLNQGMPIIDAWFEAGSRKENTASNKKTLRAMYVEEARYDTINKYYDEKGTYGTQDIKFEDFRVGID